jgi:hypothetical protein
MKFANGQSYFLDYSSVISRLDFHFIILLIGVKYILR